MPEALMVRSFSGLAPADPAAAELLAMIARGEVVMVKWSRPRNLARLKWWFALVDLVRRHSNRSKEQIVTLFKIAAGHADEVHVKGGHCPECGCAIDRVAYLPKSIAFSAMDEDAFKAFCDQCVALVTTTLIPGASDEAVRRELEEMVA